MKNFFATIPNRLKAVYLIWVGIHFFLMVFTEYSFLYKKGFYPFVLTEIKWFSSSEIGRNYWGGGRDLTLSTYDYSEFLIYTLTPIIIYFVIKLWNKKDG